MSQPKPAPSAQTRAVLERWRLVLGQYANRLDASCGISGDALRRDAALGYLYGREYQGRGLRDEARIGPGSLDASQPHVVDWLGQVRDLFPSEAVEIIEKHALDRYGLTELLTDPQTLEKLEPNQDLLRMLMGFRHHLHGDVLNVARRIIRQVVDELRQMLAADVRQSLTGRLNRHRHSPHAVAQNFDALGTIAANLKHYDRQRQQLLIEKLRFFQRNQRRLPWDIILCVDQSGSMVDSVIHSAVMASILAALPAFRVRMVLFDTQVVDVSAMIDDPVELLLSAQLGGGTHIARALQYCGQLVEHPHRTVLVLISDFCEGGPPSQLLAQVRSLAEARVKLLGLAALDGQAHPFYDRTMAERLAACGMEIAALTPRQLAQWLAKVSA